MTTGSKWMFDLQAKQALLHEPMAVSCGCVGPQNGQPVCPCQMRFVQIKDGRYVRTQDLGPAPAKGTGIA